MSQRHRHDCAGLFGCGEETGTGVVRQEIHEAALTRKSSDRLTHADEIRQEALTGI